MEMSIDVGSHKLPFLFMFLPLQVATMLNRRVCKNPYYFISSLFQHFLEALF